jgi:hypothetical protein
VIAAKDGRVDETTVIRPLSESEAFPLMHAVRRTASL